jgi:hypothetical protein
VTVSGEGPFYYQWRKNGVNVAGANGPAYIIASAQAGDTANYSVFVTNDFGEALSRNAAVAVYPPPIIREQPRSASVTRGSMAVLSVLASSFTTSTQTFTRAAMSGMEDRFAVPDAGRAGQLIIDYDFFAVPDSLAVYVDGNRIFDTGMTNGSGTVQVSYSRSYYSSGAVEIVVNAGLTNLQGTAWSYQVRVVPDLLQYQWRKDGAIVPGATAATLVISSATASSAGQYTVTVSDGYNSVVSQPATLTVLPPTSPTLQFVRLADGSIQLLWDGQIFYLETAADVSGAWEYMASGINSLIVIPGEGNQFFRLRENYTPFGD